MSTISTAKRIPIEHNVCIRVLDAATLKPVCSHTGHNAATNSMLTGIGHYLTGEGVLNQGYHMLGQFVPRYISLGTMGLYSQESDVAGLPAELGGPASQPESERFQNYMLQPPGFGADGYDFNSNNGREYLGLGPVFLNRPNKSKTVDCELISPSFPRADITFRDVVPESQAEFAQTIDIVFSAMISTGALAQFREPGKDYIYITEAGLWGKRDWFDGGDNGLLAGYRIAPPNQDNWIMVPVPAVDDPKPENPYDWKVTPQQAEENRQILKKNIIRVGINQVVQVIWKVQLGGLDQFGGLHNLPGYDPNLTWIDWDART